MSHKYQDLISLFNNCFSKSFNTRLIKGCNEPLYLPKNMISEGCSINDRACDYNQVIFAHGYYASALHEIAHWCQAGEARRELEDFGYWYIPDGRNEQQQQKFEQVEIKPQAIEWAFCIAAKKKFNVSADNLNGFQADTTTFTSAVFAQVQQYLQTSFPLQAEQFIEALANFYQVNLPLTIELFLTDDSTPKETC